MNKLPEPVLIDRVGPRPIIAALVMLMWSSLLLAQTVPTYESAQQLRDLLSADGNDRILQVDQAFMVSMQRESSDQLRLKFDIHPGHYLYRKKISVAGPQGQAIALALPVGVEQTDAYFGTSMVLRDSFSAVFHLPPVRRRSQIWVSYQGCADSGICYPPQTRTLNLAPESFSPIADVPWHWVAPAGPLALLIVAGAWIGVRRSRVLAQDIGE